MGKIHIFRRQWETDFIHFGQAFLTYGMGHLRKCSSLLRILRTIFMLRTYRTSKKEIADVQGSTKSEIV